MNILEWNDNLSMFNFNPWSKATTSMPYALSQGDFLGIASLKPPCLGLQEATIICPAWPDGLGNPSDHLW